MYMQIEDTSLMNAILICIFMLTFTCILLKSCTCDDLKNIVPVLFEIFPVHVVSINELINCECVNKAC